MAEDRLLRGLHIVVTRPRAQAAYLVQRIGDLGGRAILFPLLEISPPPDPAPLQALIAHLHEFDLAVFISPNAVHYGMQAISTVGSLPPSLSIATVGQGSAKILDGLGVKNVISPQDGSDSEALLALPELQQVRGWRVLIFRGGGGRELLGDTLKARGAAVEYAECYRRIKPQLDIALLRTASPDAITVTSSEALAHLWDALDAQGRYWIAAIPLFVQHERIAEAARKLGWHNAVTAAGGDEGLLAALVAWAKQEHSR